MTPADMAALWRLRPGDCVTSHDARDIRALLSALEEARREVGQREVEIVGLVARAQAAESRADALRDSLDDEHELTTRLRVELAQERARSDAAWRAGVEAAAQVVEFAAPQINEAPIIGLASIVAARIRALPPPSATPNEET